jgi:hypothetical protein
LKRKIILNSFALLLSLGSCVVNYAQMITGIWKGKINRQKSEVKIIQNGDSLAGTSYYYEAPGQYRRYSIKGYFDAATNEAVWWDDYLVEEKNGRSSLAPGKIPLLSRADFNCPGDGKMMLDGKAGEPEEDDPKGDVHLDKTGITSFPDEWDYVINNYLTGANDPWIIDSISAIAYDQPSTYRQPSRIETPVIISQQQTAKVSPPVKKEEKAETPFTPPPTIEQKYITRKKILVTEIPVSGDSIELRFYDNAEIDGDSISLFLNDKLVFQHIRLLGSAYTIKLPVQQMGETNELTMVAENLGAIPPNTSYMIAVVGDKRYEARLESTEGSSAMIRFVKSPVR